jgi:hypothetical protein
VDGRWVTEAKLPVFGVSDRFGEEHRDVLIVEGVMNLAAVSASDDETEMAEARSC